MLTLQTNVIHCYLQTSTQCIVRTGGILDDIIHYFDDHLYLHSQTFS